MLTVQGDVRTLMTRLLNVQTHPHYYEHVVLDTLLDSKDFVFQKYHFTYTKNIGKWIPAFLVPNLLRVQNDSSFDFVHNGTVFVYSPWENQSTVSRDVFFSTHHIRKMSRWKMSTWKSSSIRW